MTRRMASVSCFALSLGILFCCVRSGEAAKINGTISATMTINEDSQLVGDVTCAVNGAPCISITASRLSLDLNGFTISGQNDPQSACSGGGTGTESGITANNQTGVIIRGPGIVQRFKGFGISLTNTSASSITNVTTATNCFSGIFLTGGSNLNELAGNISIRNGNSASPCGGI